MNACPIAALTIVQKHKNTSNQLIMEVMKNMDYAIVNYLIILKK